MNQLLAICTRASRNLRRERRKECFVACCVLVVLLLLLQPLDGAPVSTYLRGQDLTQANLTSVITTITTLHDSLGCSVQCKKSPDCGGFSVNETGCFLYTAGETYTDEAIVPVGYFPA